MFDQNLFQYKIIGKTNWFVIIHAHLTSISLCLDLLTSNLWFINVLSFNVTEVYNYVQYLTPLHHIHDTPFYLWIIIL
jgi:hypothetical protein